MHTLVTRLGKRARRAYTAVEVMLALTVLLISTAGVMSMQKASIQANVDARRLDTANQIARIWLDRLAMDSANWNSNTPLNQTLWLGTMLGNGFLTPAAEPSSLPVWSPAFDILGRDLPNVNDTTASFCTKVNVSLLANGPSPTGGPVPVMLEVTVLVFWPKNLLGAAGTPQSPLCPGPSDVANYENSNPGTYHMLFATEALRRSS